MSATNELGREVRAGDVARYWAKVDTASDCWHWRGDLDRYGYGKFYVGRKSLIAHRVAYELLVGPIPDGLVIDHLCRIRHCVNPAHMEPVTNAENVRRGARAKGGICHRGHDLNGPDVYIGPQGRRDCLQCRRVLREARRGLPAVAGGRRTDLSVTESAGPMTAPTGASGGHEPPTATPPSSPRLGVVVGATRPPGQVLPHTLAGRDA